MYIGWGDSPSYNISPYRQDCTGVWDRSSDFELCNECLCLMGTDPSSDDIYDYLYCMGVPDGYETLEAKKSEVGMLSDILGTVWFCVICMGIGCVFGVYLYPWLRDRLGR